MTDFGVQTLLLPSCYAAHDNEEKTDDLSKGKNTRAKVPNKLHTGAARIANALKLKQKTAKYQTVHTYEGG